MKTRIILGMATFAIAALLPTVGLADAPYNTPTTTVKIGGEVVLYTPPGTSLAQFPGGYSLDRVVGGQATKRVFFGWAQGPDDATVPGSGAGKRSDNGGETWPYAAPPGGGNGMVRLRNGKLFDVSFVTRMLPLGASTGTTEEVDSHISSDEGLSWTKTVGILTANGTMKTTNPGSGRGGFLFHRSLWQSNDGAIYGTFYGYYNSDTQYRTVWAKTTDLGATWSIINSSMGVGTNEAAVVQCPDGSLFAAMRGPDPNHYVYYTRSTNAGTTWSTIAPLQLNGANARGVDPELRLLTNGVMVLSAGRPDSWIAISTNNGTTWTHKAVLYAGAGFSDTSGYMGLAEVEPQRVLAAYDTGASQEPEAPSPNPFSIRYKHVNAVKGPVQRIDLKTKAELGLITVTTNMNYSDPTLPPLRPHGAFDGSSYYWAAAFKDGSAGDGSFIINLDKPYTITNLGILLKRGYAESATISFSTNGGATWGSPVKTYTNATHYALDYTTLTPVANVNAVKVITTGAWSGLNEIELYTNHDTFENESDGNVPSYWTNVNGFGVYINDAAGYQSKRSLNVNDYLTTGIPVIQKISTNSSSKTIKFRVYPADLPNGFTFSVKANVSSGVDTAFHFSVTSNGTLQWYNGTSWNVMAGAGTIAVGSWQQIQINATLSSAQVLVNGVSKGSAGVYAQSGKTISSLKGLSFGGWGTPQTGDNIYFDDVELP